MGLISRSFCSFHLSLLLLLSILAISHATFTHSRATFYRTPDGLGTPSGACGYGVYGRDVYGGNVGAVSKLYINGAGCGACYQVRCTNPQLCTRDGVKMVVTDQGYGDNTDFILSAHAFAAMARPKMAKKLMDFGVVDVDYNRISCQYPGHNLKLKVKKESNKAGYLALIFLYQGGQKDITAVELLQKGGKQWIAMRRAYGGVWDVVNPPKGSLTLRFLASGDHKWYKLQDVVPYNWKAGQTIDTGIQLNGV